MDPATAKYDSFDPALASLKLVQVVFRHGARTPLNAIYNFRGVNWTHCRDHYQGVEVELHDENGGAQAPPILDPNTPELPGGCRQGTLTEAGYGMALELGSLLRSRYVDGPGPTAGFLPDLGSVAAAGGSGHGLVGTGTAWGPAVATLRTTPIRRTVATLRGLLTGLWPRLAEATQGKQGGPPRAMLPVGASIESREIMYGNNNTCARLGSLHEAMQRDLDASDARDAELPRLARLVAEALGLEADQTIVWGKLYDHLAAMIADGSPMPRGATREVLDIVWAQAERHEAAIIGPGIDICSSLGPGGGSEDSSAARRRRCQEVLRLGIGMLVQRLFDNMEARVASATAAGASGGGGAASRRQLEAAADGHVLSDGSSAAASGAQQGTVPQAPSQLYLFSGHDSSVMPLLAVLGQPANAWPPFASDVIFELWQAGPAGAARRTAVGRRGLADAGSGSGTTQGPDPGFWVRILYNGAPLVVPGISTADGWSPLDLLRQHVMLPYAIGPEEHTAACSREDVSDLDSAQAPARTRAVATTTTAGRTTAVRQRAARHATL